MSLHLRLPAAIATLADLEARYHDLVDPETEIHKATRELVKVQHEAIEFLAEKNGELQRRVEAIEAHPALSVPELDPVPLAAAELSPNNFPAESTTDSGPASSPAPEGGGQDSPGS